MQLAEFTALIKQGTISPYMSMEVYFEAIMGTEAGSQEIRRILNSRGKPDLIEIGIDTESEDIVSRIHILDMEAFFDWNRKDEEFNRKVAEFIEQIAKIDGNISGIDFSCTVKFTNEQGE